MCVAGHCSTEAVRMYKEISVVKQEELSKMIKHKKRRISKNLKLDSLLKNESDAVSNQRNIFSSVTAQ